jgi:hypothetical protein
MVAVRGRQWNTNACSGPAVLGISVLIRARVVSDCKLLSDSLNGLGMLLSARILLPFHTFTYDAIPGRGCRAYTPTLQMRRDRHHHTPPCSTAVRALSDRRLCKTRQTRFYHTEFSTCAPSVSIRDSSSTTTRCSQNIEQSHDSTSGDLCRHAPCVKRTPTDRVCYYRGVVNYRPAALQSAVQHSRWILGNGTTTVYGPPIQALDLMKTTLFRDGRSNMLYTHDT